MRIRNDPKLHWPRGVAHLRFYDPERDPPRKSVSLKTSHPERALEAAGRMKAAWHLGVYNPWDQAAELPTMQEAIADFIEHKERSVKPTSIKSIREVLLRPDICVDTSVGDFTTKDAEAALFSDGARQTMKRRLITLKSFFRWLVRTEVIDSHPILYIKTPRVYRSPPRYLTPEQIADLYELIKSEEKEWLARAIMLGLGTGARAGSLLALTKRDVVRLSEGSYGFSIWHNSAKTDGYMAAALGRSREYAERLWKERSPNDASLLIANTDGRPIPVDRLSAEFSKIRDHLGWEKPLTFHSLRHTFASHLVLEGVDIYTLKDLLGHRSVATTERYAHLVSHRSVSIAKQITFL